MPAKTTSTHDRLPTPSGAVESIDDLKHHPPERTPLSRLPPPEDYDACSAIIKSVPSDNFYDPHRHWLRSVGFRVGVTSLSGASVDTKHGNRIHDYALIMGSDCGILLLKTLSTLKWDCILFNAQGMTDEIRPTLSLIYERGIPLPRPISTRGELRTLATLVGITI